MNIHESADVAQEASVSTSAIVWHHAQIREGAKIGDEVSVGRGVYIGPGVQIGSRSKIQNLAMIYEPARLANGVFIGPGAILTNDRFPRAVRPGGEIKGRNDWVPVGVEILEGASVGAGAICVAPIRIGRWAMIAAGSIAVQDVPDFALVAGSPARQLGWVGRTGQRLTADGSSHEWVCPETGERYREEFGSLWPCADSK